MFYIEVKDPTGNSIFLDGYMERDGKYIELYIGETYGGTRTNTCIHISFKENDKEAVLQDLNYRQSCDIHNTLKPGSGTQYMLQGALKYLIEKYKHIKVVSLSDVAQKKGTRVYLTPKRLLLGQPGWYESQFGAKPTERTEYATKKARDSFVLTPELISLMSKPSWGKADDLEKISRDAGKLIHSDWLISNKTIKHYPVKVVEYMDSNRFHGGKLKEKEAIGNQWKKLYDAYVSHWSRSIQEKYNHR